MVYVKVRIRDWFTIRVLARIPVMNSIGLRVGVRVTVTNNLNNDHNHGP